MAIMIPSDQKDFNSPAEKDAYDALADGLSNSVTVFYSYRWLHPGEERGVKEDGGDAQGEGDFVVFDPARGVMVIEVKGGRVWWETASSSRRIAARLLQSAYGRKNRPRKRNCAFGPK